MFHVEHFGKEGSAERKGMEKTGGGFPAEEALQAPFSACRAAADAFSFRAGRARETSPPCRFAALRSGTRGRRLGGSAAREGAAAEDAKHRARLTARRSIPGTAPPFAARTPVHRRALQPQAGPPFAAQMANNKKGPAGPQWGAAGSVGMRTTYSI